MTMKAFVGKSVSNAASAAWHVFQSVNRRVTYGSFQPKWAPAPLLKSHERSFPELGFPRETDSLCPRCVKEVREAIVAGQVDWHVLVDGRPGEIKARIVEEDGKVFMVKTC